MDVKPKIVNKVVQISPYDLRVLSKQGYVRVFNNKSYVVHVNPDTGELIWHPYRVVKKEIYVKG